MVLETKKIKKPINQQNTVVALVAVINSEACITI